MIHSTMRYKCNKKGEGCVSDDGTKVNCVNDILVQYRVGEMVKYSKMFHLFNDDRRAYKDQLLRY